MAVRGGRGKAGKAALKAGMIQFRVSDAEKAEIERAAKRATLSVSAWLRQQALKAARTDSGA